MLVLVCVCIVLASLMATSDKPTLFGLCTKFGGEIQVRKLALQEGIWYDVPEAKWSIKLHPEIDKFIQKKEILKENGRRTAIVPLVTGRNKEPSDAARKYLGNNGALVLDGVALELEQPPENDDDLNNDPNIANRTVHSSIIEKLGKFRSNLDRFDCYFECYY